MRVDVKFSLGSVFVGHDGDLCIFLVENFSEYV
jgi:hypothetical protein